MTDAAPHDEADAPDKRRRLTADGFVTDAELVRELNLPDKIGRQAIAAWDAGSAGMRGFPPRLALCGGRRYWPAVREWLSRYYGVRFAEPGERIAGGLPWTNQRSRTG